MSQLRLSVLIADNDRAQREELGRALGVMGFSCEYSDLNEGMLGALRQHEPDVLLMSLVPHEECRSFEVEQSLSLMLAARCQRVGLPVVALLEEGFLGLSERALCLGMVGCVSRAAGAEEAAVVLRAAVESKNAVDFQAAGRQSLALGISYWRNQAEAWA